MMQKLVNGRPRIRNTKSLTALGEVPADMLLDASSTLAISTTIMQLSETEAAFFI